MRRRIASIILLFALTACRQEMADQPRYEPYEASDFFPGESSARPTPLGTVARGLLREDEHFFTGKLSGELVNMFPFPVTLDVLERGKQRYEIFCTPCHDQIGTGRGPVILRGFRRAPPSFHLERMRTASEGHFFDVMTNGFGSMADYAAQISPRDRWAIVGYIRALQLSQAAALGEIAEQDRLELEKIR